MTSWLHREEPRKDGSLRKSFIIRCLRRLFEAGVMYNGPIAMRGTEAMTERISYMMGRSVAARYLYDQAVKAFGTYYKALVAAKLPADEIVLYSNANVDYFALAPGQTERVLIRNARGELVMRHRKLLGNVPLNPEQALMKGEVEAAFLNCLPARLRDQGTVILDIALSMAGDESNLEARVKKRALGEVTERNFNEILDIVKRDRNFRKYLTNSW